MATTKWKYTWTAEDARIAGGSTDKSAQGPYVTPYGIRGSAISGSGSYSAGTEYDIEIDSSVTGEPWRARRFHEYPAAAKYTANFEWHKPTIPDSVKTLGDLCKHLREKDSNQYPNSIYGDAKVKTTPLADNAAQMLFDYPKNTKYRYAVVKQGFDWNTYGSDPGSIPISKNGITLEYVLRKVTPAPKAAAAPGEQKKTLDMSAIAVENYIHAVSACVANIRNLLALSDRVMRERYQSIYRLKALRAIAEASVSNPEGGFASDGPKIVKLIDDLLPKLHKVLVELPIAHPANTSDQKLGEIFKARKEYTMDAVADLKVEQQKLHRLLLESGDEVNTIAKWAKDNHANFLQGVPAVVSLVDRMTATMSEGHLALGECESAGHDDVLLALLDGMKDGHATKPDDINGTSGTEVALSFVGKGTSIALTTVGNLAGPPSLSIAVLQVWGSLRFAKLAKGAYAELNAIPSGIMTVSIATEKWIALSDRLVKHLPDGQVKDDVKVALLMLDKQKLAGLRDKVGETMAGSAQQTVPWKGAMAILGLLGTILSIRDAANTANNKSYALQALDFVTSANSVASVSLGTYESFMTYFGRFEKVAEAVAKAGNVIGVIGGITGAISGAVGYADAYKNASGYGMASNALGAVGSAGMAIVAGCAIFGVGMPVVAAVALACLLASGAVSVAEIVEGLENTKTKSQVLCHSLVVTVRKDVFGLFAEFADANIVFGMEDLQKVTKEGFLPNPPNNYFVVMALAKAGLSESMMREVVNSSALANTPIGPGPGSL